MLYRKAIRELEAWNSDSHRKPLVVWGARQVGKTFLVRDIFAESFFKGSYVYIDCKNENEFVDYINSNPNCEKAIQYISVKYDIKIDSKTLIIFDEIQECPVIVSMLKYFCQDHKEIPVIATGSMVRLRIKRDNCKRGASKDGKHLFPIGKIDQLTLYPMTFDEYLYNRNHSAYEEVDNAFKTKRPVNEATHMVAMSLLNEYMMIGGLPEVVDKYLSTGSLRDAIKVIKTVYDNYLNDMGLYQASPESCIRSRKVFDNIYSQLNKEQKNYSPSNLEKGMKNRDLIAPMDWLSMAHLIHKSYRIKDHVTLPLIGDSENVYRIYMGDVGLFTYQSGVNIASIIYDSKNVLSGIFFENYVAAELVARDIKLYYWTGKNSAEMEFLIQSGSDVMPIDVKKGRGTLNSLKKYTEHNSLKYALKVSSNNYGYDESSKILTIPLYMFPFYCDELVEEKWKALSGLDEV